MKTRIDRIKALAKLKEAYKSFETPELKEAIDKAQISVDMEELEYQLTYGRGIPVSRWNELIEYRTNQLILKGENPKEWTVDSRFVKRIK